MTRPALSLRFRTWQEFFDSGFYDSSCVPQGQSPFEPCRNRSNGKSATAGAEHGAGMYLLDILKRPRGWRGEYADSFRF